MSPQRSKGARRWFSHRYLIAAETLLLVNAFKDWLFDWIRRTDLANAVKVLVVMAATVGILGGVFLIVERMTARGVSGAHSTLRRQSGLPTVVIHAAILVLLFFLYARMLKLPVLT